MWLLRVLNINFIVMKKIICLGAIIALVCISCGTNPKDKSAVKQAETGTSANVEPKAEFVVPSDSGVIQLKLVNGETHIRSRKVPQQNIEIQFQSDGYKKLKAHLSSPDSMANIRFSQVTMPDGTMDGPFGRDLEYDLPQKGLYKVSIHESMMAGDPWGGEFAVDVVLTGK